MGFDPSKVSGLNNVKVIQQQAFKKRSENQYNQQEIVTPRIVYHYAISPNDMSNNGYILGVLKHMGEDIHVKITVSEEAYQAQKTRDAANNKKYEGNFNGAYIDTAMASLEKKIKFVESNEVDKKFVLGLEGAVFKSNKKEKINGIEYTPVVVRRIINFKSASKAIEGFFTAKSYFNKDQQVYKISNVDHWLENPVSIDDDENINKIMESLDILNKNKDEYDSGNKDADMLPNTGVKFIMSRIIRGENGDEDYEILNTSGTMDSILIEEGKYRPLSREFLPLMMQGYKDYVFEAGGPAEMFNVAPEDVLIEMAIFKSYRPTTIDDNDFTLNVNNDNVKYRPLYRMTMTPYLNSVDDTTPTIGRNLAFTGFIKISPNKFDQDSGKVSIQSLVTNTYFGTLSGNVLAFLRNAKNGKKYQIHETLRKRYYTEEEKIEMEKRKEEKLLKEGKTSENSLSKGASLSGASGLSLNLSQDSGTAEVAPEDLFEDNTPTPVVVDDLASNTGVVDASVEDDDIPF